jgi:hypothetical protein
LAFQILECARNAFEEHNEPALTSDLADTYMYQIPPVSCTVSHSYTRFSRLLADVHLENDNFGDGRADLQKAFDVESKAPGGPRVQFLADVLVKIAVSFLSDKKKADALPHLNKAKALLQAAIDGAQQASDATGVAATSSSAQSSGKARASIHDPKTLTADDLKALQSTLADVDAKVCVVLRCDVCDSCCSLGGHCCRLPSVIRSRRRQRARRVRRRRLQRAARRAAVRRRRAAMHLMRRATLRRRWRISACWAGCASSERATRSAARQRQSPRRRQQQHHRQHQQLHQLQQTLLSEQKKKEKVKLKA